MRDTATQYHGLTIPAHRPAIILFQPQMPENIGMVARAMANCGLDELRIVQPRDGWPHEKAFPSASGADTILHNAKLYDDLPTAVADRTLVFGTCAFERELVKPILTAETAATAIIQSHATAGTSNSAIIFGPERTGLTKDDMSLCDGIITLPLNPDFASLNIAQSVLLVAYCWWQKAVMEPLITPGAQQAPDILNILALQDGEVASQKDIEHLYEHALWALKEKNYFTNPQNIPAQERNARSFLQRMRLTLQETRTAHGMIKALLDGKMWVKD